MWPWTTCRRNRKHPPQHKKKRGQKESSNAGVAEEISLTGEKPAQQRKRDTKKKRIAKKGMDGSEKGREWRLGAIDNKIKISNSKISLINHIYTPPNPTSTNMLEISDSGANIHLSRQATPTMFPVIMDNKMKERLPDGSTMESTHIATLQIPGLSRLARQINISPKTHTAPLISLGVLCDYGCTITLDKQVMSIYKNEEEIIKWTRNRKTGMWKVPLGPHQSGNVVNNILAKNSRT